MTVDSSPPLTIERSLMFGYGNVARALGKGIRTRRKEVRLVSHRLKAALFAIAAVVVAALNANGPWPP
jgi:hypothetical protein